MESDNGLLLNSVGGFEYRVLVRQGCKLCRRIFGHLNVVKIGNLARIN